MTEPPRGGHFAPFEEPELYARELREFFRPYRAAASASRDLACRRGRTHRSGSDALRAGARQTLRGHGRRGQRRIERNGVGHCRGRRSAVDRSGRILPASPDQQTGQQTQPGEDRQHQARPGQSSGQRNGCGSAPGLMAGGDGGEHRRGRRHGELAADVARHVRDAGGRTDLVRFDTAVAAEEAGPFERPIPAATAISGITNAP